MNFFYRYDKPGKGVDENEPEKKGIVAYFQMLWRHLRHLSTATLLYSLVSLPFLAVYFILSAYISTSLLGIELPVQMTFFITFWLFVFFGSGPCSAGYAYILRNCARGEHVFTTSDFFDNVKENLKSGLIMFVADLVILFLFSLAMFFYYNLYMQGNVLGLVIGVILIFAMIFYIFMHFYLYQMLVTFEGTFINTIKNSFAMSAAFLPANLAFLVLISAALVLLFTVFNGMFAGIFILLIGMIFFRFPIDFYVARKIKRMFIDKEMNNEM